MVYWDLPSLLVIEVWPEGAELGPGGGVLAREGGCVAKGGWRSMLYIHRRGTTEVSVGPCDGLGGTFGGCESATNDDEVRVK
mgnify:FL=1